MADVFSYEDATALLMKKHVMFLGDSNIRAQYKDLVWLLNENTLMPNSYLRKKLEETYLGDKLVERGSLDRGRGFQELREYDDDRTRVDYMFIPRCFNCDIEKLFTDFKIGYKPIPDVIVVNSCMWDLTRWGPNGVSMYKDDMVKLMRLMSQTLPQKTLVIWTTALPTAAHVKGGLIIKQIQCMEPLLRFEVMEANTFARDVVVKHGFDLLDYHFQNRMQIHRRARDGIHYSPVPVRFMTNLLLTHIALSWGCDLPGNIDSILLHKAIDLHCKRKEVTVKMPTGGILSRISKKSPVTSKPRGISITFGTGNNTARRCTIVEPIEQPTLPNSQDSRPILHRLYNQHNDQSEVSAPTNKQTGLIRSEQLTPTKSRELRSIVRFVCNLPNDQSGTSAQTDKPAGPTRSDQLTTQDPLDSRPILRRLYNQPVDQSGPSVQNNQQAGPIRNRNQRKNRKKNYDRRSDKYRYHY